MNSVVKGQVHDVYYWCDICTIKRFEAGICDCCGMNLDFREEPAKNSTNIGVNRAKEIQFRCSNDSLRC